MAPAQDHMFRTHAVIDAEAPSGNRHEQMVASFNRGYSGFQQTYHICTPAAGIVMRRYMEEGAKIARDITRATQTKSIDCLVNPFLHQTPFNKA